MAKEKTLNYTPEMESEIRAALSADVDQKAAIVELAEMLGKSVASVRQKAVRMGLYRKSEYVSKTGDKPESKESISGEIAELLGVNAETAESLAKANKGILVQVRDALRTLRDLSNEG
jgi:hypothetical protein